MLVELRLVEQRYQAVLEVLAGATVTDVARRYGVARQTVHGWLRRYGSDGLAGLADRSSKPGSCPHQTPADVEARIVELRRAHPGWGPRTIGYHLEREGVDPVPSRSSIYRALVRHKLIDPQKRRKRRSDYKRWERARPMELWQMDITGGVRLTDGAELKVVTGIDDHSRFCVSARVVRRATAKPVCDALAEAMRAHGVPDQILTDNGKVFTGRFGPGTGEVLFDRICRENGIRHLLTAPRSPTHKVLGRAVIENAASAAWILEPGIGVRLRIARGRNERIYSANQILRLDWLPDQERGRSQGIVDTIIREGSNLGFSVTRNGWLEEVRPGFTSLIRWLLGDDLGSTIANYYSAVTHGTQYGLVSAVMSVERTGFGLPKAAIGLSSGDVNLALGTAGLSLIRAIEHERNLMGRSMPDWERIRSEALETFKASILPSTDS